MSKCRAPFLTCRERVIHDDDIGIVIQRPSDVNPLLLSTTQVDPFLSDLLQGVRYKSVSILLTHFSQITIWKDLEIREQRRLLDDVPITSFVKRSSEDNIVTLQYES
jgi:hypothetical protein